MDIDLSVLRSLESEKDISLDQAIKAIEDALLVAYHKSEGASATARVEVDRKSGHVTVWAIQTGPDGAVLQEYDDTPAGFGRIAATTARQVILQRLRDVEDELTFGEYAGREGDIVAGVIQQGKDPRTVLVDLGKLEAILPPAEQVPGERYIHGERIRCYVLHVRKGHRGPSVTLSRTHPGLVKKLFALEVPEIADGAVDPPAAAAAMAASSRRRPIPPRRASGRTPIEMISASSAMARSRTKPRGCSAGGCCCSAGAALLAVRLPGDCSSWTPTGPAASKAMAPGMASRLAIAGASQRSAKQAAWSSASKLASKGPAGRIAMGAAPLTAN